MTFARQRTGAFGEDLACRALEARGWHILARRYRTRGGEIDIVARDAGTIVFVEVKARQDRAFGDPADAVTARKQQRIVAMATDYLARHGLSERPVRFDVASVVIDDRASTVEVFIDAFRPGW